MLKPTITYYSPNFTSYHSDDTYSQEDSLGYISQGSQSTSHLTFLPISLVASCYLLLFFFWNSSCCSASGLKLVLVCFFLVFFPSRSKRIPSLSHPVSFRCCDMQIDTPILNLSPKLFILTYINCFYTCFLSLFSVARVIGLCKSDHATALHNAVASQLTHSKSLHLQNSPQTHSISSPPSGDSAPAYWLTYYLLTKSSIFLT